MRRICLRPDGSMVGRVVIKDVFLVAAVEVLGFEIKRRPGWCRSIYPHRLSQGHHGLAHAGESDAELRKTDIRMFRLCGDEADEVGCDLCGGSENQRTKQDTVMHSFRAPGEKVYKAGWAPCGNKAE